MEPMVYCMECKRIFTTFVQCPQCSSRKVKPLARKAPVNVIGTKIKGKVMKIHQGIITLLTLDEHRNKTLKEYDYSRIRKVL